MRITLRHVLNRKFPVDRLQQTTESGVKPYFEPHDWRQGSGFIKRYSRSRFGRNVS